MLHRCMLSSLKHFAKGSSMRENRGQMLNYKFFLLITFPTSQVRIIKNALEILSDWGIFRSLGPVHTREVF